MPRADQAAQLREEIPPDLTGEALAEELGLEAQPSRSAECQHYVEVDDPVGYCIDAVVSSDREAWELGYRLRGRTPTEREERVFQLVGEIAAARDAGDADKVDELTRELQDLTDD